MNNFYLPDAKRFRVKNPKKENWLLEMSPAIGECEVHSTRALPETALFEILDSGF
jgi:hypothetical protein